MLLFIKFFENPFNFPIDSLDVISSLLRNAFQLFSSHMRPYWLFQVLNFIVLLFIINQTHATTWGDWNEEESVVSDVEHSTKSVNGAGVSCGVSISRML